MEKRRTGKDGKGIRREEKRRRHDGKRNVTKRRQRRGMIKRQKEIWEGRKRDKRERKRR